MKKYESSRGWRNNNPLNIRQGAPWTGLRAEQTDRQFCQFLTMSFGFRAAAKVMRSYFLLFSQQGREFRVDTIVNRWAPPTENETSQYVCRVLELMGRQRHETALASPYTVPGRLQLALLVAAMTCVETGCPPQAVPVASLNTGFVLAGLGDPQLAAGWWR